MASTSTSLAENVEFSPGLLLSPRHRRPAVILLACGSFNPPTYMHLRMFELARDHLHRRTNYRAIEGVISVVNDAYKKKDLVSADHRLSMVRLALENSKWIRVDDWEAHQTSWCPTVNVLRHIRNVARQRLLQEEKPKVYSYSMDDAGVSPVGPSPFKKPKAGPSTQSSTESSGVSSILSDHHHQHHLPSATAQAPPPSIVPKSASIDVPFTTTLPTVPDIQDEPPVRIMLLCGSDLLQSFEVPNLWAPEDMEEIVRDFGIVVVTRVGFDPRKVVYESDLLTRYEDNIHYVTEWIANDVSSTKIRRALKRAESVRYLLADKVLDYIYQHNLYGCTRRAMDILSSPSLLMDTGHETPGTARAEEEQQQLHCSYHPQYRRQRKSVQDESDYDNLAPCPCPLTSSASAPNAAAMHLIRAGPQAISFSRVRSSAGVEKTLSLDVGQPDQPSSVVQKPQKFPTDLESALSPTETIRNTVRPMIIKSALKSPPTSISSTSGRQRAVSYHSDLSRSTSTSQSQPLPSSRTLDISESMHEDWQPQQQSMPFGSVSMQQRSLSNLIEIHAEQKNGKQEIQGPTATVPKSSQPAAVTVTQQESASDTEEITWHYNPELTKSMPNLRLQRQTPPRHVRIMDKGVCFAPEDERLEQAEESDEASSVASNLVVKIKQLKLTMSPETTV